MLKLIQFFNKLFVFLSTLFISVRLVCLSNLVSVSSVGVSEPLDVVEDEPGEGDDHQHDEGDGDEHHRRPADVLLQVPRADGDRHGDSHVALQK